MLPAMKAGLGHGHGESTRGPREKFDNASGCLMG